MDEIKTKQQVVEKIKGSSKILVTVSNDPSVDELSAALALTLLLDKQGKYATAIFSGETPPAIAFLEPEKTFDDTTDSLRDFIIALNKEKADHLRYKVVDNAVKIFITPYKTTITEDDLEFSQGDYNVELVIALGVNNQDHLDRALANHGQILHNASIVTVTAGDQTSNLGGIDWHDAAASSLSEMVSGLAEALKDDKKKSLLDGPIATALLTGIVAQTDRFSNEHTTSKALSVASALMGAGANQQLIANELQEAQEIGAAAPDAGGESAPEDSSKDSTPNDDGSLGSMSIKQDEEGGDDQDSTDLSVNHENETLADLDRRIRGEDKAKERVADEVELMQERAKKEEEAEDAKGDMSVRTASNDDGPTLGGTLNATSEQAADDARREAESDRNRTLLSHSYLEGSDESVTPGMTAVNDVPASSDATHSAYALDNDVASTTDVPDEEAPSQPVDTLGPTTGGRVIQPLNPNITPEQGPDLAAELAEVASEVPSSAYAPEEPVAPVAVPALDNTRTPTELGLPLPPPIPDFSQLGAAGAPAPMTPPPAIPLPPTQQPEILGDILAPDPLQQPAPLPPLAPPPAPQPLEPTPADPGQFQIPSQQ